MTIRRFNLHSIISVSMLAGITLLTASYAVADPGRQQNARQDDAQVQATIEASLSADRFKGVQVSVKNGVVDLLGTVELYAYKEEVEKKAHRNKEATSIRNEIQVAGPLVADGELQKQLVDKVQYDRVGYGTAAFNAISVGVHDGVVTLGGHAYGPTDKGSALSVVSYTKGVRDVVDEIEVDPLSPMDDRIRMQVARSVYGAPSLNRYAIDPGKPIRISVQNGNVTLYGAVDNQMDKEVAGMRVNSVPGIFKVTNELQVQSEGTQSD